MTELSRSEMTVIDGGTVSPATIGQITVSTTIAAATLAGMIYQAIR